MRGSHDLKQIIFCKTVNFQGAKGGTMNESKWKNIVSFTLVIVLFASSIPQNIADSTGDGTLAMLILAFQFLLAFALIYWLKRRKDE